MLKNIERSKLRDIVAARLKSYIVSENLQPGDRLPTETELAEMFGVSRLSLREATKSLGFLGIIDAKPGRGLTVGRIDMDRVTEYLGFHPALHNVDPQVLIDTRIAIETSILPHVAKRMDHDPTIHQRLQEINDRLRRTRSLQGWVELDIAFHRELIRSSGLTPLMAFSNVLSVFFQRFRESVKAAEWRRGIESHQELIDALYTGRVTDADAILREHIGIHSERMIAIAARANRADAAKANAAKRRKPEPPEVLNS